jgi:uncharacterized protein YcbK (DUF882 family)
MLQFPSWFVNAIVSLPMLFVSTSLPVYAQEYNTTPSEYIKWLSENPEQAEEAAAFERFIEGQGVANILPTWQLFTPDAEHSTEECPIAPFVIPSRQLWANVVPTLRLVRDKIKPTVGPVKIISGYRPPDFNKCINGAPKSAHMSFSAFDMVALNAGSNVQPVFDKLCTQWKAIPVSTQFGLGAYFDKEAPELNSHGTFHVDTWGQRTWGFDYTYQTSYCLKR